MKKYKKYDFYKLYTSLHLCIITHSTGIEGSTLTVDDVKDLLEKNVVKGKKEKNDLFFSF